MRESLCTPLTDSYAVMKFVLPKIEDLKYTTIQFDCSCKYLGTGRDKSKYPSNYILNFTAYCKKQINYYNHTAYDILTNKISLILPTFPKDKRHKRGIITSLITGFIGLGY